ncbi:MAG TPA: NAD(P)-binding domain-containing protein, partial [Hyphomicrobiaceae bacterium]|nr:NAD(P)-binding domain-containing protein [Hyphomicrobiaceae bacterium]
MRQLAWPSPAASARPSRQPASLWSRSLTCSCSSEPGVAGKVTIAIIGGTGALGAGLGRRLAGAGHTVLIGSRSAAKAEA